MREGQRTGAKGNREPPGRGSLLPRPDAIAGTASEAVWPVRFS
jgi:hypothetical protein